MVSVEILPVDVSELENARAVHAIQMAAYSQEAELLGVRAFPPLNRTVQDIQVSTEKFLGAWASSSLVGALGYEPAPNGAGILISSLVVSPDWQRRSVGRSLVAAVLSRFAGSLFSISTGAKNNPALGLYNQFGFVEQSRNFIGPERLELVALCRPAP